jgi:hypothetical protein
MYYQNKIMFQMKSNFGKDEIRFPIGRIKFRMRGKQVSNGKNRDPRRDWESCETSVQG